MSLQPQTDYTVPGRTAEVAHAAFPKGNPYIQMRTELGTLFQDEDFTYVTVNKVFWKSGLDLVKAPVGGPSR